MSTTPPPIRVVIVPVSPQQVYVRVEGVGAYDSQFGPYPTLADARRVAAHHARQHGLPTVEEPAPPCGEDD